MLILSESRARVKSKLKGQEVFCSKAFRAMHISPPILVELTSNYPISNIYQETEPS
jgi:hypothetical protein